MPLIDGPTRSMLHCSDVMPKRSRTLRCNWQAGTLTESTIIETIAKRTIELAMGGGQNMI